MEERLASVRPSAYELERRKDEFIHNITQIMELMTAMTSSGVSWEHPLDSVAVFELPFGFELHITPAGSESGKALSVLEDGFKVNKEDVPFTQDDPLIVSRVEACFTGNSQVQINLTSDIESGFWRELSLDHISELSGYSLKVVDTLADSEADGQQ